MLVCVVRDVPLFYLREPWKNLVLRGPLCGISGAEAVKNRLSGTVHKLQQTGSYRALYSVSVAFALTLSDRGFA
ncbi:hypothetical protein Pan153_48490 [Gimesia panareensis]|uniref:Uncharacterized protein n=1 Tax=Gimesia panareensis TaxID=2527978 RepID=A0A518FV01_9PLAN|nr:hypothetical protein Pan153_48490 [Gimesia panareensis]